MTPKQIDLAKAAMKLPGWKWTGGMMVFDIRDPDNELRIVENVAAIFDDRTSKLCSDGCYDTAGPTPFRDQFRFVVHLADPTGATDGCLLKLLGPKLAAYYSYVTLEWAICIPFGGVIARSPRLADACCEAAVALGRWPGGVR